MRTTLEPALVLRKHDYSETSQILRLITRDTGVVSVLAKGTKKPKSSFGGALDLFYLGDARILHRPAGGLMILAGFAIRTPFPGLRRELYRLYATCHLAELVVGMTREEEPHPELFDLLVAGIARIEGTEANNVAPVVAALELAILKELGFAPELSICAGCGGTLARGRPALSVRMGGTVCPDCTDRDPTRIHLGPGALGALRNLAGSPPERATRLRLSLEDARKIREFLTAFEEWRLERRLRAAPFL